MKGSPDAVVLEFFRHVDRGKVQAALALVTERGRTRSGRRSLRSLAKMPKSVPSRLPKEVSGVRLVSPKRAVVVVVIGPCPQEGTVKMDVVAERGRWLIDDARWEYYDSEMQSRDRRARSNLRNGVTAAQTFFVEHKSYEGMNSRALSKIAPELTFGDAASLPDCTRLGTIYVVGEPGRATFELAVPAESGRQFRAVKRAAGGVWYSM